MDSFEGPATGIESLDNATGEVIKLKPVAKQSLGRRWDPSRMPPPRDWLYKGLLVRKFASAIGATGGTGKTQYCLSMAVEIAMNQSLLGGETSAPTNVLYCNLEDPQDEFDRRLHGICRHHRINKNDLADRMFTICGREQPLRIVTEDRDGPRVNDELVQELVDYILENKIGAVFIDPFVSSHGVSENSNDAQDLVIKTWGRIADRTNAAVLLVHHLRKPNSGEALDASAMRGGSALVDGVRALWLMRKMTSDEAAQLDVSDEDRGYYFSLNKAGKANLTLPPSKVDWFKMQSVCLDNGTETHQPDWVGVPEVWEPPKLTDLIENVDQIADAQRLIGSGTYKHNQQATAWAGHIVGQVLGIDTHVPSDVGKVNRRKCKRILEMWIANGALKIRTEFNARHSREVKFVEAGEPVK